MTKNNVTPISSAFKKVSAYLLHSRDLQVDSINLTSSYTKQSNYFTSKVIKVVV
jgi:hypothetical protein